MLCEHRGEKLLSRTRVAEKSYMDRTRDNSHIGGVNSIEDEFSQHSIDNSLLIPSLRIISKHVPYRPLAKDS